MDGGNHNLRNLGIVAAILLVIAVAAVPIVLSLPDDPLNLPSVDLSFLDDEDEGDDGDPAAPTAPPPDLEPTLAELPTGAIVHVAGVAAGTRHPDDLEPIVEQAAVEQTGEIAVASPNPVQRRLRREAFERLLLRIWAAGEARDRGIEITRKEIRARIREIITEQFDSRPEFDEFAVLGNYCTGKEVVSMALSPAPLCRELVRAVEADLRLGEIEAVELGGADVTDLDREELNERFNAKWTPRTICAPAYVIEGCSNFSG